MRQRRSTGQMVITAMAAVAGGAVIVGALGGFFVMIAAELIMGDVTDEQATRLYLVMAGVGALLGAWSVLPRERADRRPRRR